MTLCDGFGFRDMPLFLDALAKGDRTRPLMRRKPFSASRSTVVPQRDAISEPRQRLTLRHTSRDLAKQLSIGFVVCSETRSLSGTLRRCIVSVCSNPSSRPRAVAVLIR